MFVRLPVPGRVSDTVCRWLAPAASDTVIEPGETNPEAGLLVPAGHTVPPTVSGEECE